MLRCTVLMVQSSVLTAASPGAGACRLRRFCGGRTGGKVHCRFPMAVGGSAASRCLRRGADAYLPHGQGADMLRCSSNGAIKRIDGGKPRSRGLPPAAFLWRRTGGKVHCRFPMAVGSALPASAFGAAVPPASAFGGRVDAYLPHGQGADMLRCTSNGAIKRIDGGKPRSRGLPPAAFLWRRAGRKVHCRFPLAVGGGAAGQCLRGGSNASRCFSGAAVAACQRLRRGE